jgi:coenzyme F420-reducing hydrogenase gamma subunit
MSPSPQPPPAHPPPAQPQPGRPRLAVWKFASCDGCQLTLLDCEDELLAVADAVDIRSFLEAGVVEPDAIAGQGRYDVSLVEGSITTPADVERIGAVRAASAVLVTIGACATTGGIQALRNFGDVEEYLSIVYAQPQFISTLATSTAIADHVAVDVELRGCPIDRRQLLEVLGALLAGRRPVLPAHSVCLECKLAGNVCVTVAHGTPCLGPITHAGCGALCPTYHRGCYGCFGPMETPNTDAMCDALAGSGMAAADVVRALRTFNGWHPDLRAASSAIPVPPPVPVALAPRPGRPGDGSDDGGAT